MADQLLTIPQVAAQLVVGRSTVYRYIAAGLFDRVDLGRGPASKTRIPQSSVDRFVKAATRRGRHAA
jgi:excisionase family DNA binding protein